MLTAAARASARRGSLGLARIPRAAASTSLGNRRFLAATASDAPSPMYANPFASAGASTSSKPDFDLIVVRPCCCLVCGSPFPHDDVNLSSHLFPLLHHHHHTFTGGLWSRRPRLRHLVEPAGQEGGGH